MAPIVDREPPHHGLGKERRRSSRMLAFAMILVAVLTVGGVAGLMVQIGSDGGPRASETPAKVPAGILYAVHSPILIASNADFTAANGVSGGTGTESDPYIIADWDIDTSSAIGIDIENADAHFIVRDCYVHHPTSGTNDGIDLYNCVNATLENNTCSNNWAGIYLASSGKCTLTDNNCSGNGWGMWLYLSSNNTLNVNNCSSNNHFGIEIESSSNNILSDNYCTFNSADGIHLASSGDNTLGGNNCSSNSGNGIYLPASYNNTLSSNNCSMNAAWGIYLETSVNNTLDRNNCSMNMGDGFMLDSSSNNNTLVSNIGYWNVYNGVDVIDSRDNLLISNIWSENAYHGAYLGYSTNNTLDSNNCSYNAHQGIQIRGSDENIVLRNQLYDNVETGMYVYDGSSDNIIFNNTFVGNNGATGTYSASHIQAIDDGTNNSWNSTDGYGNYWSDWTAPDAIPPYGIVDAPYNISGSAGAQDNYPQTTPLAPIPEFGAMPFVVIAFMGVVVLALERERRKKS